MITIITGSINSGKTTKLLELYERTHEGDGLILSKVFKNGQNIGQMIRKLSTGDQIPFSIRKQYISDEWDEIYSYKDYSFSKRGLEYASLIINEISEKHITPVFLDEIGPLELEEKGFSSLLTGLLGREAPLYLTIRESLLTQVINHFHMEAYEILNLR